MKTSGPLKYVRLKSGGYRLLESWWVFDPKLAGCSARVPGYIQQSETGELWLGEGYQCDGPSGPTVDTDDFLAGSFAHDAGYQLLRARKVPADWRKKYDQLLYDICRSKGMPWIRAQWVYWACRMFAGGAAKPRPEVEDQPLVAP